MIGSSEPGKGKLAIFHMLYGQIRISIVLFRKYRKVKNNFLDRHRALQRAEVQHNISLELTSLRDVAKYTFKEETVDKFIQHQVV